MKLKVKMLADATYKKRKVRTGQELVLDQEQYIDWYFETGRDVPHEVKEEQTNAG